MFKSSTRIGRTLLTNEEVGLASKFREGQFTLTTANSIGDMVKRLFHSTLRMSGSKVGQTIYEIQDIEYCVNRKYWKRYSVMRDDLADTNKKFGMSANEAYLFHGTRAEVVDQVIQNGFDKLYCHGGVNAHGHGVYFATDADLSASRTYAPPDAHGNSYMFLSRVLVGRWAIGDNSDHTQKKDRNGHIIDSLADKDMSKIPSKIVVMRDNYAYPEFLITFKRLKRAQARRFWRFTLRS